METLPTEVVHLVWEYVCGMGWLSSVPGASRIRTGEQLRVFEQAYRCFSKLSRAFRCVFLTLRDYESQVQTARHRAARAALGTRHPGMLLGSEVV